MSSDADPFLLDVIHLLGRYTDTARHALAAELVEDRWEQPATALASMGVNASDEEEALRQRRVEEEQSVGKALDRFSSMASAENRRWVTGSNELLQMYFAARQQELDVVRRCFTDAESKAKFTAAVTDRTDSHLGPLKKLPSSPQPQEPDLDSLHSTGLGKGGESGHCRVFAPGLAFWPKADVAGFVQRYALRNSEHDCRAEDSSCHPTEDVRICSVCLERPNHEGTAKTDPSCSCLPLGF